MSIKRCFPFARSGQVLVALAAVVGVGTAVVVAEQATVQRPRAEVLDAKGSAGDVIAAVPQNTTLEVLAREGNWVRVRTPDGKEGYISNAFLEKSSGGSDLLGMTSGSNATGTGAAAAGRGWDPEVEAYVSSNNLNRSGLERMERERAKCRGKALKEFEKRGHLGGAN